MKFDSWFKEQFGEVPSSKEYQDQALKVASLKEALLREENTLNQMMNQMVREDAAKKAFYIAEPEEQN